MEYLHQYITEDKILFLCSHLLYILVGFLYRKYCSPFKVSSTVRHCVGAALGLILLFFMFGWSTVIVIFQTLAAYCILWFLPLHTSHIVCCIFVLGYNLIVVCTEVSEFRVSYQVSFPLNLSTQKLCILACSLHDGLYRKDTELNSFQRKHKLTRLPTLVELFGYIFYFGGVFLGPGFFYLDYKNFIDGTNLIPEEKKGKNGVLLNGSSKLEERVDEKTIPSPVIPVLKKGILAVSSLLIFVFGAIYLPPPQATDLDLAKSSGFLYRNIFVLLSMFCHFHRIDFVFTLGEMVQNASGFGFHYVNANPEWNLTTNVNMAACRSSISLYEAFKNWNIFTSKWLRYCFYERAGKYGLLVAFTANYLWHGADLGFFVCFQCLGMAVVAARKVRRTIRPHFVNTRWKPLYDVITWAATQTTIFYATTAYYILNARSTLHFYAYSMYWYGHIALLIIILLPLPQKKVKSH